MKFSRKIMVNLATFGLACASVTDGATAMDNKEARIAAKVFNFLHEKPQPGASVVVIGGAADVAALTAALTNLKVTSGSIADTAHAVAVFVNSTAEADAARRINPRLLIISADTSCIDADVCVIAVVTSPKVSVYLSRKAASNANIDFDTSFKMLVTER